MYNFSDIQAFMKILVFCISYLKIRLLARANYKGPITIEKV